MSDSPFFENFGIIVTISSAVIVGTFAYCTYLNLRIIPRAVASNWYRTCISALTVSFGAGISVLILAIFWAEALSWRHPNIARIIGYIEIVLIYLGVFCLALSVVCAIVGMVLKKVNSRNGESTKG